MVDRSSYHIQAIEMESVIHLLSSLQRETDCERALMMSCRIARSVILQPTMGFLPMWKRQSNKHVCIGLDRRMYFDNHQVCYHNNGIGGKPCILYDFGSIRSSMKILAVILYHAHIGRGSPTEEEKEVCLLVLSADGFLRVFEANTGFLLRSIFLSTTINYRYLQWADYLHTVQVKSIQYSRQSSRHRNPSRSPSSRLLVIAVFRIHPLELVACFSVDREVFGADIVDVSVNQDVLVVSHSNGYYRLYSLSWIIAHQSTVNAQLSQWVELGETRAGFIGGRGFGVPLTINITKCPPMLFETRSSPQLGVSFGGSPTVYLHNPSPQQTSVFQLHCLHSGRLVSKLSTDTVAFHQDVAEFHHDDYLRLLHISGCSLSCYQLVNQGERLVKLYTTDFRCQLNRSDIPMRSSSGRTIKRRVCTQEIEDLYVSAVQDVDFENELDLLYAVVTLPNGEGETEAWLFFLADRTGHIIKRVSLPTWKPDASNSIYYELDCILHLVQDGGLSTCHYYRLCRTQHC